MAISTATTSSSFPSLISLADALPMANSEKKQVSSVYQPYAFPHILSFHPNIFQVIGSHLPLQARVSLVRSCRQLYSTAYFQAIILNKQHKLASKLLSSKKRLDHSRLPLFMKCLNLSAMKLTPEQLGDIVRRYCTLESLVISDSPLTEAHIDELRKLTSLKSLIATNCGLTDAHLAKLDTLTKLSKLIVCRNPGITGSGFANLQLPLTNINVKECSMWDTQLVHLKKYRLEILTLSRNEHITGATFAELPETLEILACDRCSLDDEGIGFLQHLRGLEALNISGNERVEGTQATKLPLSLTSLTCAGCSVKPETVEALKERNCHLSIQLSEFED